MPTSLLHVPSAAVRLAAEEDSAQNAGYDPFDSVAEISFIVDDADVPGYSAASNLVWLEVKALLKLA
jgi:hypothetical protein